MSEDIVSHAGGALSIDDDFRSLIPPLSDDEYRRLERSIIAEGVRDPIITWNGTIIDGHNRYRICHEHGIAFKTAEREFDGRDAAKIWIIENQFARRNLNSYQKSALALQLEPLYAAEAKRKQIRKPESVRQNSDEQTPIRTDERLAQVAGVSRDTIRKVKTIETEAEKGNEAAIAARDALRSGESKSINSAYAAITGDSRRDLERSKRGSSWGRSARRSPDATLSSNVAVFTPATLLAELSQSADEFGRSVRQSLDINEENGASLTRKQRGRLVKAVDNIIATIDAIAKEYADA